MKGAVAGEWLEIGVQQKVGRNEFSSMFLFLPLVLDCSNSFIVMQQEEVLSQCFLSLSVFPKCGVVCLERKGEQKYRIFHQMFWCSDLWR